MIFASNGKFYTLDASKLPGGRGHGEPVRLYFDIEQDADVVAALAYQGKRKFLVASYGGNGFVVPEDDVLGTTRKGKQVLNLKAPDKATALTVVDGELIASIGTKPQDGDLRARRNSGNDARSRRAFAAIQGEGAVGRHHLQSGRWADLDSMAPVALRLCR